MKPLQIRKITSLATSLLLVFQSFLPTVSALSASRVYAQEETATNSSTTPTATPTPEITVTPTPDETPAPTPTPALEPTVTETPTPSVEGAETVAPTPTEVPTPTTTEPPHETGPPDEGQILDGASTTATPTPTAAPTPTPTVSPEQPAQGHLTALILDNVKADTLNLDAGNITSSATLTTDKTDYAPTDTAVITGSGFAPNHTYSLTVSSDDPPATTTTVDVKTEENGSFIYAYQLDGTYRPNYSVVLKDGNGIIVASTTFTDAAKTASVSGNWSNTATWGGSAVPTSADDVTINPGITVTVTADAAANSITFANSGTATGILTVNTGVSLAVTNGITLRNAAGANTSATLAGAGTISAASLTAGGTTYPHRWY